MRKKLFVYCRVAIFASIIFLWNNAAFSQPTVIYEPFISSGLAQPMEITSAPGDVERRFFIVEKEGTIRVTSDTNVLSVPFLDIRSLISSTGERGLLSMAFHPEYTTNRYFFVYYTDLSGSITVARYRTSATDPNIAEPTADPATPLITIPKNYANHNGGHLQFRTEGGVNYLYFGTGDGGSGNDPDNNAQNTASFLGKMIRIDVDAATVTPEIWAIGLRNPFRWSFDRNTQDMWIGDVGQSALEEIDFLAAGSEDANFGWPCYEGRNQNMAANPLCTPSGTIDPVFEYDNPSIGKSVVGGYVYRGAEFPLLQGYYLATDYFTGRLWLIKPNGPLWDVTTQENMQINVSSISETTDGSLYIVSLGTQRVYKVATLESTPLALLHFSGRVMAGYNELRWTTSMEAGIQQFIIEYSTDGVNFTKAGELGASNNSTGASYVFKHSAGSGNKLFYRLQIIEADGTHKYSPIILLGSAAATDIKLYPTIVTNGILQVNTGSAIESVRVFSMDGQKLFSKNMQHISGYFTVQLPALQKGVYIVQVTGKGVQKNQRIIIP